MSRILLNIDTPTNQEYTINGAIYVDKYGRCITKGIVSNVDCNTNNGVVKIKLLDATAEWSFSLTHKSAEALANKILDITSTAKKAGE